MRCVFAVIPSRPALVEDLRVRLERTPGVVCETADAADAAAVVAAASRADILVTPHSLLDPLAVALHELAGRVPSLTLQDGLIEYRHAFKPFVFRSGLAQGRYRPLLTDRIAVFGEFSRRVLESWGTAPARITVTGAPRLERFAALPPPPAGGYLLLATATTPFFQPPERAAFCDLFARLLPRLAAAPMPVSFRLSRVAAQALAEAGLAVAAAGDGTAPGTGTSIGTGTGNGAGTGDAAGRDLADHLAGAAAVLTTSSTLALEAMLAGRPTAILRYDAQTLFLHTPWQVAHEADLGPVLAELRDPPAAKLAYQRLLLADQVSRHPGGATEAVARLVLAMAADRQAGRRGAAP